MFDRTQRTAYAETLVALGKENKNIVVLDADLGKSTMGCLFKDAYPDRYFEMGIAEQNMMSTAAGLSLTGKIPFVNSFAVFVTGRAYDQLRQTISIAGLNVKVCGSSAGLSDFGDGSTHQSVEDIALMRAIPHLTVLAPVDDLETEQMVRYMVEHEGPMYLRVNRNPLPRLTGENTPFVFGKPTVLREGNGAVVFAHGIMVEKALRAAETMKADADVKVVNVGTLKPLADAEIIAAVGNARGIVVAEEHSVIGGLCSIVAQAMRGQGIPMEFVAIQDEFGTSAHTYDELLERYSLTAGAIRAAVENVLK